MNENYEAILSRLKRVLTAKTDADVARGLNVSTAALSAFKKQGKFPYERLINFCLVRSISIDWLLTGQGEMKKEERAPENAGEESISYKRRKDDEYVHIPLYDIRTAASGRTIVDTEHIADVLSFKASWIASELRANPSDLYLIFVQGESMEPTLRPGDIILIDRRESGMIRDGIYILRLDGGLLVKRLQRLPGQIVKVISDNPVYESFNINAGIIQEDLEIIGRVVWCGRRM